MKYEYDKTVDGLYIWFVHNIEIEKSQYEKEIWPVELNGEIGLLFDKEGVLMGLEIMPASKYFSEKKYNYLVKKVKIHRCPRGSVSTTGDYANGKQMTPEGWGQINFNWRDYYAKAMFFGCRTASDEGGSVTPWVQTISKNANMKDVTVWGQTMRSYPSQYPNALSNTSDMRNNIHRGSAPTYMVGGARDILSKIKRNTGLGGETAYPMAGYYNGKFVRTQMQWYKQIKY